jgi:hypothetical protein
VGVKRGGDPQTRLCLPPPSQPFPATASAEGAQFNVPPSPTRGKEKEACTKFMSQYLVQLVDRRVLRDPDIHAVGVQVDATIRVLLVGVKSPAFSPSVKSVLSQHQHTTVVC